MKMCTEYIQANLVPLVELQLQNYNSSCYTEFIFQNLDYPKSTLISQTSVTDVTLPLVTWAIFVPGYINSAVIILDKVLGIDIKSCPSVAIFGVSVASSQFNSSQSDLSSGKTPHFTSMEIS